MEESMQKKSPTDLVDAEHYYQDIVDFVQMLQRRLRGNTISTLSSELDKAFAYEQIPGPWRDQLRVFLSAGRRAGWTPPTD